MSRTPAFRLAEALGALAAALLAAVVAGGCGPADGNAGASRQAAIAFRYSRFTPDTLEVPVGVPVTFTLRNDDPIDHEWIIGPPEVHAAHRVGTEPVHASRPTEVTVPALSTRVTTVTFERAGDYAVICHLPGHEAYGMRGTLRVAAR